ncbi:MAG TPA: ABC transporter permease, partial [Blastocatellia bacterium]|nr:ABC transporter permease [Blastocatellia bacterium]
MMETILQDLHYGFRMLLRQRVFTSVAVLALALGIGANTAIFSVINAVLLHPLPYSESGRLVRIWEKRSDVPKSKVSMADLRDWQNQNQVFEQIAAFQSGDYNLTGVGDPEQIQGASISANLFSVLHVKPEVGRAFTTEEEHPGSDAVAIISYGSWIRRFGSDPVLVGKTINIDNRNRTIVGIMHRDFGFPDSQTELWVPLAINPNSPMAGRGMHILQTIARLRPGITVDQAKSEMETIAFRLEKEYPRDNTGHGTAVFSLLDDITGSYRSGLLIIFCAVGLVLLIACANVANLMLARATARRGEIALRMALGAKRSRIIRQLLTESILLSAVGGVLGLALAFFCIKLLIIVSPNVPRIAETKLDSWVLLFTFLISIVTGILFGLAPAIRSSRPDINKILNEGGRGGTIGFSGKRLLSAFVIIEVALSLILLIGSGLMIKSFLQIQDVNRGFSTENILTASITLPVSKYRPSQRAVFMQQVLEGIQKEPGVQSVGAVTHLPLAGNGPVFDFEINGRPPAAPGEEYKAQMRSASPDYFKAMGIQIVSGRQFTSADSAGASNVVIVNDVMAQKYWKDSSPLGQQISFKDDGGEPVWRQIVGIVRGVRHTGLESEPEPQMYAPYYQFSMGFMTIVVRTSGDPLNLVADLRHKVFAVDKDLPVSKIRTMSQIVSESVAPRRFNMLLLSLFAGIALVLASVGIYGVISYSVSQRTNEIGIRLALGAQTTNLIRLIVGQGIALVAIGISIGLLGSLAATRFLSSLLFHVSATDPLVFVATPLLLAIVAILA